MINYSVVRHDNGKIRIVEDRDGEKRFVTKHKKRYFDDREAADIIMEQRKRNEHKSRIQRRNEWKKQRTKVNI